MMAVDDRQLNGHRLQSDDLRWRRSLNLQASSVPLCLLAWYTGKDFALCSLHCFLDLLVSLGHRCSSAQKLEVATSLKQLRRPVKQNNNKQTVVKRDLRTTGIEPVDHAWEARMLPLHHMRFKLLLLVLEPQKPFRRRKRTIWFTVYRDHRNNRYTTGSTSHPPPSILPTIGKRQRQKGQLLVQQVIIPRFRDNKWSRVQNLAGRMGTSQGKRAEGVIVTSSRIYLPRFDQVNCEKIGSAKL